jgi:hypothetical protein
LNREYNVKFESMAPGAFRHVASKWTRAKFFRLRDTRRRPVRICGPLWTH